MVTDANGLIYMRARYYSPSLRRFINADIVAGNISNAITLNRFAYANGNPVSFIDPFGLSADRCGCGNNCNCAPDADCCNCNKSTTDGDSDSLNWFDIIIDAIMGYKGIFKHINKIEIPIYESNNITLSCSIEFEWGEGDIDVVSLIAGQLNLAKEFPSFKFGEITSALTLEAQFTTFMLDNNISVKNEYDIDKYHSISYSLEWALDSSVSLKYTDTRKDAYKNSIATSLIVTYKKEEEKENPTRVTVTSTDPSIIFQEKRLKQPGAEVFVAATFICVGIAFGLKLALPDALGGSAGLAT